MLGEITAEHIDRYKTKRNREVSPVSVNVELRMLKSAFSTAKRWKLIEGNPCDGVPFVDVPEQVPLFLTGKECQTLVDCIREGWFRELVLFAVLTGLKRGEILSLRWADVDLSRRVVNIQTSSTFRTKQGRRRTVTLNDSAFYLLSSKQGKSCAEYVFTLNDKPIFDGWVTHLFKKYVRRAKLSNDRLHFHSLRHTFASRLVQKGATLYEVQRLLGHTSSKVTEVYSRLQPEQLHSTVNRIDVSVN
jgi:integrase